MPRPVLRSGLVVSALLGASLVSAAPERTLPVALEYQAIEGCPSADAFWEQLSSRARRVERTEVSQALATLRISVIVIPQGVLGRLQIVRPDFTTEPRFVEAANCEEVVQALALTAALSVEGEVAPRAEPAPPPNPPPSTPTPPSAGDDSPYTDRRLPIEYVEPPAVTGRDDWETQLNGHGIAAYLVDRHASLGFGGSITFARKRQVLATQMLGLGVSGVTTALTDGASATRFTLTQAEFVGCPTAFGRTLVLRPCALFQVGILDASGKNISDPESSQDMWWAPGAGLRLEAPAQGVVRFQLALNVVVPLATGTYQVGQPREPVAETMPFSPWLNVGVTMAP